jgi:hypothetical protein
MRLEVEVRKYGRAMKIKLVKKEIITEIGDVKQTVIKYYETDEWYEAKLEATNKNVIRDTIRNMKRY